MEFFSGSNTGKYGPEKTLQGHLKKSGYDEPINIPKIYKQRKRRNQTTQKKNNLVQSPYSKNVLTKVGSQFPKLISKHFPRHHKFYKLFNKNNVKVSYSCMPNMKNIINTHNKISTLQKIINITRTCNCIRKHQCPLNEKCLTNNILYEASITPNEANSKTKMYYGVSETAFKFRYANYKKHSITSNTKLIENCQTNIGILYQQKKLRTYPEKFWKSTNHTTKVLNDVSYVSMKNWQSLCTKTITC